MPLPATITTRSVRAQILDAAGNPAVGRVAFINAAALYDETGDLVLSPGTYTAVLDAEGEATVTVPTTDAAGVTPTGRTLTVLITTSTLHSRYDIEVPTGVGTLELADLPPVLSAGDPITYATAAALAALDTEVAAHTADTTAVHGITDTAALILEGDPRLTNARTPTAHASTHGTAGADPLTPAAIGAYPAAGGAVGGHVSLTEFNLTVQKTGGANAFRARSTGGAIDLDTVGDVTVIAWGSPNFTGSETLRQRWHPGGITYSGVVSFGSSVYAGEQIIHTTDFYARLGGKNGISPVNVCGRTATPGAPATGTWDAGDIVMDSAGSWHLCTAGGTPGTWT